MLTQVRSPGIAPLAVIAPESRAATQPIAALSDMLLTVNLPLFAESCTTGIAAGALWFHRHNEDLVSSCNLFRDLSVLRFVLRCAILPLEGISLNSKDCFLVLDFNEVFFE